MSSTKVVDYSVVEEQKVKVFTLPFSDELLQEFIGTNGLWDEIDVYSEPTYFFVRVLRYGRKEVDEK